jgi:hypothetical protein
MTPETKQMIRKSSDLLDDTWMDLSNILTAYHEKRFDVLSESLMRINERIHSASAIIRGVIFKEIIMPEAEKRSESCEVITARMDLAKKIIDLMEQDSPGNEELHYEALMLAFHASTNSKHYSELIGRG